MTVVVDQICVVPLSSPYSLLPRMNTYALVGVLLILLPEGWLFRAALAALITRTAIAALYSAVLLHAMSTGLKHRDAAPLDAFVVMETLGLAALCSCWLLLITGRLRQFAVQGLIRVWAAMVAVGAVLAFVSVAKMGQRAANDTLQGMSDCTAGVLTDRSDAFGQLENTSVLGAVGSKLASFERTVGIPSLLFSALAVLAIAVPSSKATDNNARDVELNSQDIIRDSKGPWSNFRSARTLLGLAIALATPVMAIFIMVSAELSLLSMELPSVESMASVGQWGCWAASGLVIIGILINAIGEKMGLEKTNSQLETKSKLETI
jgi:hypothetical protein